MLRTTLALTLALVAAPAGAFAQGFEHAALPIPVEIDGRPVHSTLYFDMEMKRYGVPFDTFAAGPLDKAQTMFAAVVQAIRKQDVAKFASIWTSPDQMKHGGKTTVSLANNNPANWIGIARSVFDFDHLTVVAEVLLGSESMFVWDSPSKAGIRRNAFYVGPDRNNRLRLTVVSSNAPVEVLVLDAFEAARTDPGAYKALPESNLQYRYPIPLAGKGDPGAHPLFLEFDGSPTDFPLGDENVKASTPLLEFFRSASLAYAGGKYDAYAADFTAKSQQTVRQWLASEDARRQAQPHPAALTVRPGNVNFVIAADPVFLIFHAPFLAKNWTPENLTYDYVVREGGAFKLTNFSYVTSLDDFLQDPVLFDKSFLKSPPAKAAR
ncbi:MAG: hypothetical protein ACLPYS_08415 [Vulcanimicrobiaceae bacterium]